MYKKILIPLDGSELAECVLPHVELFKNRFPESHFVFVRVVVPIATYLHQEAHTGNLDNLKAMESDSISDAQDYLTHVIDRFKPNTTRFDSEVIIGSVADILADYVEKNDVDLIIIATHGRSGVSRWVRGSVADRILHASHVPVLMVRAPGTRGDI